MSRVRKTVSAFAPVRDAVVDSWISGLYTKLPTGISSDVMASLLKPLVLNTAVFHVSLRSQKARYHIQLRCAIVAPDSAALHHEMLNAVVNRKANDRVMIGARIASRTVDEFSNRSLAFHPTNLPLLRRRWRMR